jgi:hypothetical protein
MNVGYFRTWYGGFLATDNLETTPADFDPYCITAPADSRLPSDVSGAYLCGMYDIKPEKFGKTNNIVTQMSKYGKQTQVFNGVDITVAARYGQGGQLSGGLSTGRTVSENCTVIDSPQQERFCKVTPTWGSGTQVKLQLIHPLPWDAQFSVVYKDIPGLEAPASYVASNAEIKESLGRNLGRCGTRPTCSATATVALIAPQTNFEQRLQQLDLRIAKQITIGRARLRGSLDLANLFNASDVLNMDTNYGDEYLRPIQILGGRLVKVNAQIDF